MTYSNPKYKGYEILVTKGNKKNTVIIQIMDTITYEIVVKETINTTHENIIDAGKHLIDNFLNS